MIQIIAFFLFLYTLYKIIRRWFCSPKFEGQNVWITGASSGIGEYSVYQFNKCGANIIISARNIQQLQRVKQGCKIPEKVKTVKMDMTNYQQIQTKTQQLLKQLQNNGKKLDIIVENAGISMRCSIREYSFKNHLTMFDVNVNGPVKHIQCCLQHMIKNKSGQIVGIVSAAAKLAKPDRTSYAGSKHAFLGVLDSLRSEFYPFGITVTSILPGYVHTNLSKNAFGAKQGQKFGVTDENNKGGMSAQQLSRKTVKAIYLKQKQLQISKGLQVPLGIFIRNLSPDLFFYIMNKKNKGKKQ